MSDDRIFTDRDCVEIGSGCSLKGKVVVLKESALEAGFVRPLYYCTGGNGANANALGKPVFLVNLKNGEFERCARDHVLGVLSRNFCRMRRSFSSPRSAPSMPYRWRTMNPSIADTVSWRMEGMRPGCGSAMKRKPWNMWKCRSSISTGSCSVTGMISVSGRCGMAGRFTLHRRR